MVLPGVLDGEEVGVGGVGCVDRMPEKPTGEKGDPPRSRKPERLTEPMIRRDVAYDLGLPEGIFSERYLRHPPVSYLK